MQFEGNCITMVQNLISLSAREIAGAVQTGALDPLTLLDAFSARIAERNPALNALVTLDPARSRAEAASVAARLAKGEHLPLAGVPIIIKDNLWARGWRVTQGSRLFADFIAPEDSRVVARVREAGAVIIGIGACSEFACKGVTTTPLHGVTHHPLDPDLTPGGSSGGNAAALAAGFAPIALGTDAGGSGRRPAAHCGVVGFKPGRGKAPYEPGFAEAVADISEASPMGRTVDDVALLFDVVRADAKSAARKDARIGFSPRFGLEVPVEPEVEAAIAHAIAALRAAGWMIADLDPVWPDGTSENDVMPLQFAGLSSAYGERWMTEPELFDPAIGAQIEQGLALSPADLARAGAASLRLRHALDAVFADVDLLIGPTVPCVAWPHRLPGPETIAGLPVLPRAHAVFTPRINHAGLPAISLPCGPGRAHLPTGLQIVGDHGADDLVLQAARDAEAALSDLVASILK
jgi:aspartyl-tRNA(Asn)/glutamyl-tRNA(Gln) amidotransferase subunit A